MSKIIALYSPAAQSGKSTIAHALNGLGYRTIKFAGILKDMIRTMLLGAGIPYDTVERMIEGDLKEKPITFPNGRTVTPRVLMQTLGTEWGRGINPDLWADLTISKATGASGKVIIDDMRFPNEFDAVKKAGGVTILVTRPGVVRPANCHPSEGQLDNHPFDWTVVNDGSVDQLIERVQFCLDFPKH